MKPMGCCLFGELLATVECSSKFAKQLLSAEGIGWNRNGSVTASEPFGSSQMAGEVAYRAARGLTLGRHPAWKNLVRTFYCYPLSVPSLKSPMLEFMLLKLFPL